MKKLDWKSFLFGAALGVAPIATVAVVSLTSSEATAQLWGRFRSQAVVAAPGQVVVCSETSVDDGAKLKNEEFPASSTQWTRGFDDSWVAEELERHPIKKIDDNKTVWNIKGSQKEGHTYGNYTEADALLWKKETERLVAEGSLIFHDAELLGSKNGVSCDMCHPDAEGTHAETYPKYQVQLGRVALLRDMSNWCLTQPCRGEAMSGDDPRMRALEAYMHAMRSGKPMKYGKH